MGNMVQSNQAYGQLKTVTGGDQGVLGGYGWLVGLILAAMVGLVIIGGIKSIAKVTSKIVPLMAGLYLGGALTIIAINIAHLPAAASAIVASAFTAKGVTGGVLGVMIIGFQRAVFSNEAGIGSAAIAHSAVQTPMPATEGLLALLEPLIDTVIICTLTALVLATSEQAQPGLLSSGLEGVAMTSKAFERQLSWAPYPLAVVALLFAFSTMISWAYYGLKGWSYLFGENAWVKSAYKAIFCVFVALGAAIKLDAVLSFSDAMVFVLCVPNIFGLYVLFPVVKQELQRFMSQAAGS